MSKKKLIKWTIIIYFGIYIVWNIVCSQRIYKTAEEAIMKQNDIKIDRIVTILEDKDYAVGLFEERGTIKSKYLHKTDKGWKMLSNSIFFHQDIETVDSYIVCWYKNNEKYLITIDKLNEKGINIYSPKDSINSEFKYFTETDDYTTISTWFLVLDELPKNYTITIGDKSLTIK